MILAIGAEKMSIRWKLGILFLVISLVPLIAFFVIGLERAQSILKQEIGQNFELIARDKAMAVSSVLNRRVEEATNLAKNPKLIAALVDANSSYTGKDDDFSLREIERIDRAWLQSKGDTPTARNVLGNSISDFLRGYRDRDPREYGEIFITDRLGATVAMTSTLTDYYQADEGWWREGFADGKGALYIDDRGYDLSVNAVVTGVVVPVWVDGKAVGLLKINFKMAHIPAVVINPYEGDDVTVFMHRSNGTAVIDPSGGKHETASEPEAQIMAEGKETGWTEDAHSLEPTIMGYARVQPEKPIYSRFQAKASKKGVSGESWGKTNWYVFVERSRDRAYAPLTELITVFIVSGAAVTIFIIIVSGVAAARVTNPLRTLRHGLEAVASGDLNLKIGGYRKDEIGEALRDVDRMVERLKKTMASRKELRQEVKQRKHAELSLGEKSAALERTNEAFTNAQRIAHLGNWNWEMKTGELLWSDEIYRIFGQEPQSAKANYDTFFEAIHPDDRQAVQTAVEKALHNEAPYDIDHRIVLPDGSIHFVHEQGEVVFDEAGEPLHMLGTIFDITKRKQVEEALHEAKAEAEKANQAKSEFLA
ncbi:MAG: PAS domain-containing protein, partial [Rhodospirillaceae bacterium]|nr:PAS domain-containing protein [Rhodospirillaceae bacterium]